MIGIAKRATSYDLADEADEDYLESFAEDDEEHNDHLAGFGYLTPPAFFHVQAYISL